MGPLLARFCRAEVVLPGGCLIGTRPINFHLKNFQKMGVEFQQDGDRVTGVCKKLQSSKIVLEYPSVGATENILMAAVLTKGTTRIINAALEPEVMDLIVILRKMGAKIAIMPPAVIEIEGVDSLCPIEHAVMPDRLEAGSLITAAAITKGSVSLPDADANALEVFLEKLCEMGHSVTTGVDGKGITFKATKHPKAVSFITGPYPAFPTDLQAPMMAVQCLSEGVSLIHETVFENRFLHVRELEKMGAQIERKGDKVQVTGVETIYGTHVIASDIRASCALVIAGLAAQGSTVVTGVHHWQRGYHQLEDKLNRLGAAIALKKASSKIG
jgi:UDP-N-acetylglucosamine 1-carboxyvinyltransferase